MKIGSKYKICKRLGSPIFEKCQSQKYALSEARASKNKRRGRRQSEYGIQLLEKQKVRFSYGLSEKQFTRYVSESSSAKGVKPFDALYEKLEMRLDNIVFRLGIAKTRSMARQLVSHGHIQVNGKKVNIPSYTVQKNDVVSVKNKNKTVFTEMSESFSQYNPPAWLNFDAAKVSGKVEGSPNYDPTVELFNLAKVFEFYSR